VIIVRPLTEVKGPLLPDEVAREGGSASGSKPMAQVIRVSIPDIRAGRLDKNIMLHPNDTVFVSQAPPFYVSGEVRNAGAFPFTPGLTVRQAISMAGGFSPDASSNLRVVRALNGKSVGLKITLDDPVQPGDTIVVKAKLF
jgi:polysaccharide export outer membrane protein